MSRRVLWFCPIFSYWESKKKKTLACQHIRISSPIETLQNLAQNMPLGCQLQRAKRRILSKTSKTNQANDAFTRSPCLSAVLSEDRAASQLPFTLWPRSRNGSEKGLSWCKYTNLYCCNNCVSLV